MVVVLDGIQDPGNAGAIVRTAEAFGATGALFLKGTVDPLRRRGSHVIGSFFLDRELFFLWDWFRFCAGFQLRIRVTRESLGAAHKRSCRAPTHIAVSTTGCD